LLRWHQRLVAKKWTFTHRRGPGRPGIMGHISELIVRMAQDGTVKLTASERAKSSEAALGSRRARYFGNDSPFGKSVAQRDPIVSRRQQVTADTK
jgi:hypothetical protein